MIDNSYKAEHLLKVSEKLENRKHQLRELNKILKTALEYEGNDFKLYIHVEIEKPIDENIKPDNFDEIMDKLRDSGDPKDFLDNLSNLERSIKTDYDKGTKTESFNVNIKDVTNLEFIGLVENIRNKYKSFAIKDKNKLDKINEALAILTKKSKENE